MFGAMLAGPLIGGALFGLARVIPFLTDAGSYLVSAVSLTAIRTEFQDARTESAPHDVRDGLRWIWQRPLFRFTGLLFAGSNPIFTGLYLLVVVVARRHGASSAQIGVMLAIAAAGGLAGALLSPRLQRHVTARRAVIAESWVLAIALPWLLLTGNVLLLGVIVAVAEFITPMTNSVIVSLRVAEAPDDLQGRVQAASTMLSFSAAWLGPLVVGVMLQATGSSATELLLAGWAAVLALIATASPSLRHVRGRAG